MRHEDGAGAVRNRATWEIDRRSPRLHSQSSNERLDGTTYSMLTNLRAYFSVRAALVVPFCHLPLWCPVFTSHSENETTTQVHHVVPRVTKEADNGVMLEQMTTEVAHGHAM